MAAHKGMALTYQEVMALEEFTHETNRDGYTMVYIEVTEDALIFSSEDLETGTPVLELTLKGCPGFKD